MPPILDLEKQVTANMLEADLRGYHAKGDHWALTTEQRIKRIWAEMEWTRKQAEEQKRP